MVLLVVEFEGVVLVLVLQSNDELSLVYPLALLTQMVVVVMLEWSTTI